MYKTTIGKNIGDIYNNLKILDEWTENRNGKYRHYCKCECLKCHNITITRFDNLKTNHTQSCGCYNKERIKETQRTHGLSRTPFYCRWINMKQRCDSKDGRNYIYYGGRGITYCKEWENFENFKKDMYESFISHVEKHGLRNTTLDRIDVNSNYCKENCRWATITEQMNNIRTNRLLTYNGETHTLAEWSKVLNLSYTTLRHRFDRKWDLEKMFNTPQQIKHYKEKKNAKL